VQDRSLDDVTVANNPNHGKGCLSVKDQSFNQQ
jgi:hypothetical protein